MTEASSDLATNGRVLVVDDDVALAEMLSIVLRQEGFDSYTVSRGDHALEAVRDYKPDVVLLDVMLPGRDGIDVCKEIRTESGVPIVMLTAKGDTVDIVVGLESGADDYVVKPFKPKELVARIRARVRRKEGTPSQQETLVVGDLEIDVAGHAVSRAGEPIGLTPLEFDLLLCRHAPPGRSSPGRCCSRRCGATGTPRHPPRQRARAAAPFEGGARPGAPRDRAHGPRVGYKAGVS